MLPLQGVLSFDHSLYCLLPTPRVTEGVPYPRNVDPPDTASPENQGSERVAELHGAGGASCQKKRGARYERMDDFPKKNASFVESQKIRPLNAWTARE